MIVSNEPGVYFPNQYGIRIENLCLVKKQADHFYQFEDLTVVPYARKLINIGELSATEIHWIDQYHQHVYDLLKNDLPEDVRKWLEQATRPLT